MKKLKKALLVYNPKSGNSNVILNNFDLIVTKLLKKGIIVTFYSINKNYNKLCDILASEKYDILILSGGDGTLSRTLSEIYVKNIKFPKVAIFPTGTSNDFGKSLNLGNNIDDWIYNILIKEPKYVDFGLINGKKIFLSSYASGLFSKISYNTDKNLKKTIGKVAYYLNGLTELTNIKKFDLKMQIFDGKNYEDIEEKAILFMILNGKSVAGFDEIIYNADVNDEFLHILIVKNIDNPLDISKIFLDLLNNNTLDWVYYIDKDLDPKLVEYGKNAVKAFGMKERFFHIEFFKTKDDYIAIEYNNRPAGAFAVDVYNFAHSTDYFRVYAEVANGTFNGLSVDEKYGLASTRRDYKDYVHSDEEIRNKYQDKLKAVLRMPEAFAELQGNTMYVLVADTLEEMKEMERFVGKLK